MQFLETDLSHIAQLAEERHDEFEVLRYLLELDEALSDADIDSLVERLAGPIIGGIDCTQCANCCRGLDVYVTPEDVARLADGLSCPQDVILSEHIDQESAVMVGEWGKLRAKPCAFLCANLCSVYAHRPESCRTYPAFTPDFRWVLKDIIAGAGRCPIIYNVLVSLGEHFELEFARSYTRVKIR